MTAFVVENVSVPPEVEQAIDKRSSMAAVGNLNDYVKFQMAQGMEKGGGAGAGGMAAEMAVGMTMAQQMMKQTGGFVEQATPGIATPAPAARRGGGTGAAHAGAGGAGAGRRRSRRHGEPRGRRPEGQEDRHAVARHARRGRRLPRLTCRPRRRNTAGATVHRNSRARPAAAKRSGIRRSRSSSARSAAPSRRRSSTPPARIVEHDLVAALRGIGDDRRGWQADKRQVKCQSCNAISVLDPARQAQNCEFCGSAQLVAVRGDQAGLPSREHAAVSRQRDAGARWHPRLVRQAVARAERAEEGGADRHRARRLPAVLDVRRARRCDVDRRSRALLLHDRNLYRRRPAAARGRCSRYAGSRRRGACAIFSTTTSSARRSASIRVFCAAIEPFPTAELKPYDPGYVAGWVVERYQIDLVAAAQRARDAMDAKLQALCARRFRATPIATSR